MRQDNNSLAHTTWNCKYHIVFAQNIDVRLHGKYNILVGNLVIMKRKGVEIHEVEALPRNHIHMHICTTELVFLHLRDI